MRDRLTERNRERMTETDSGGYRDTLRSEADIQTETLTEFLAYKIFDRQSFRGKEGRTERDRMRKKTERQIQEDRKTH